MKLIDYKSLGSAKGINYSRDHLRRRCKAGEFPKPITVSDHRKAWIEAEIDAWLAAKKPARDTEPPVHAVEESLPREWDAPPLATPAERTHHPIRDIRSKFGKQ